MHEIDMEKSQREESRWRVLRALDAGRPHPVAETIIFRALHDIALSATPHQLRRELTYLEERKLIEVIGKDDSATWLAKLTRHGIDVVEYTVACEAGIARPKKYW